MPPVARLQGQDLPRVDTATANATIYGQPPLLTQVNGPANPVLTQTCILRATWPMQVSTYGAPLDALARQGAKPSASIETERRLDLEKLAGPTKGIAWVALILAFASWIEMDTDLQQDGRWMIGACMQLGLVKGTVALFLHMLLSA